MPNHETPAKRYRRLAQEALDVAQNFPHGEHRDALLQMAQVWQRLADTYADSTTSLITPAASEQPVVQQQEQIQPKPDDKKE
jgi:hypothetical protein